MLARLAENLFWMGRYVERAEDIALLLDVTYHGHLESSPAEAGVAWWGLLEVLHLDQAFLAAHEEATAEAVARFLVVDESNLGSVAASLGFVRENARSVRELISTELWEAINTLWLDLRARDLERDLADQPHELYRWIKLRCQTIYGVASETMPRDDGWRFSMLGRMLERAEMTCRLLNVRYQQLTADGSSTFSEWAQVLKSASAFEAYRKTYRSMEPQHVVEFLLLSENLPRSVLFSLRTAEHGLAKLGAPGEVTRPQRLIARLRADLEFREVGELLAEGLHAFLDRVESQVWAVADAVAHQFFRHELRGDLQLHVVQRA